MGSGIADTDKVYPTPVRVGSDTDWSKVITGGHPIGFHVALKSDGTLWSWGSLSSTTKAAFGLGDAVSGTVAVPTQVHGSFDGVEEITFSYGTGFGYRTYVRDRNGDVWVCGNDQDYALGTGGNNTDLFRLVQKVIGGPWAKVVGGQQCGAGIKTDGTIWAWGNDSGDNAGIETTTGSGNTVQTPIQVSPASNWTDVILTAQAGWRINAAGEVFHMGYAGHGLGDGTYGNQQSTTPITKIPGTWSGIMGCNTASGDRVWLVA